MQRLRQSLLRAERQNNLTPKHFPKNVTSHGHLVSGLKVAFFDLEAKEMRILTIAVQPIQQPTPPKTS